VNRKKNEPRFQEKFSTRPMDQSDDVAATAGSCLNGDNPRISGRLYHPDDPDPDPDPYRDPDADPDPDPDGEMRMSDSGTEVSPDADVGGIAQLFAACDLNQSGFIEEEELRAICHELSHEELADVFQQLDRDSDGKISLKEFADGFQVQFNHLYSFCDLFLCVSVFILLLKLPNLCCHSWYIFRDSCQCIRAFLFCSVCHTLSTFVGLLFCLSK